LKLNNAYLKGKNLFSKAMIFMDIKLCDTYSTESKSSLTLMHQNIWGLLNKNELMCSLVTNQINLHFIYLCDHFLSKQILGFVNLENLSLSSGYSHSFSRWWYLYIHQKGCRLYFSWCFWKLWWDNHRTVCCASQYSMFSFDCNV
jgi:hypothetical protein